MSVTEDSKKIQVVAALLGSLPDSIQRLLKRWERAGVSMQMLSSWDEASRLHPEIPLLTDPSMLQECPQELRLQIMARRAKLMVAIRQQEEAEALKIAAIFLQESPNLMIMGADVPFAQPILEPVDTPSHNLTNRELQVLKGIAQGKTNAEIGQELCLAGTTVKGYIDRLFEKLGCHKRANAVTKGFRQGILR